MAAAAVRNFLFNSMAYETLRRRWRNQSECLLWLDRRWWSYTLKFKPIKLNHPAHFVYHFSGLPHWNAEILFAIEGPEIWEWKDFYDWHRQHYPNEHDPHIAIINDLKGTLAISLKDTCGHVILHFQDELSKLTWSQGGSNPPELYDEHAVNFTPEDRKYTLEVTVIPDPRLKGDEGYILIRGGGLEPPSIGF